MSIQGSGPTFSVGFDPSEIFVTPSYQFEPLLNIFFFKLVLLIHFQILGTIAEVSELHGKIIEFGTTDLAITH